MATQHTGGISFKKVPRSPASQLGLAVSEIISCLCFGPQSGLWKCNTTSQLLVLLVWQTGTLAVSMNAGTIASCSVEYSLQWSLTDILNFTFTFPAG